MSGWTIAWLVWGGGFVVVEGAALLTRAPDSTLSQHIWRWFRVKDPRPTARTWVLRAGLAAFLVWLLIHLTFGVWPS